MITLAWLSLAGLLAGEAGAAAGRRAGVEPRWVWLAASAGWIALAVHMVLAMAVHHGWSHTAAVTETARLTGQVYGLAWGGGVYVNYAFLLLWLVVLFRWRASGSSDLPAWLIWTWRIAVLVVVSNAAVVFAAPARRLAGAIVTAALIVSWWVSRRPAGAGR
jgi:hypothetical protein